VWPDFRKGIWRTSDLDAHRKAFLEGDFDFFTKSGDLNVWCHGAAGIGLSRLRAYELLGNPEHRNDALTALETCRWINEKVVSQKVSFTLCHGIGGVVELFLEAYLRWNAEDCLALSADVVERILKAREAQGIYRCGYSDCRPQEDSSLFNGDAGIGYLCLRVLDPLHTPSVLMPVVADSLKLVGTGHFSVGERFTLPRVKEMILQKTFPRTVQSLKGSLPVSFTEFLRVDGIPADTGEIDRFVAFVKELLPGLTNDGIELLQPAFGIELEKVSMDRSVVSNALIRMKELVLRESAVGLFRLDTEDFLRAVLVLDGAARVIDIHSDSPSSDGRSKGNAEDEVLNQERDGSAVLLKALPTYVAEIPLSALSGRIVRAFVEEKTVGGAIDEIAGDYDCELGQKGKEVRLVLLDQIKEALKAGILIPPQVPSRVN
jgi:hypothetical protein